MKKRRLHEQDNTVKQRPAGRRKEKKTKTQRKGYEVPTDLTSKQKKPHNERPSLWRRSGKEKGNGGGVKSMKKRFQGKWGGYPNTNKKEKGRGKRR